MIKSRKTAVIVGVLILAAYTMLTYTITNNVVLGFVTDIISGLAVIGIPLLLLPFFTAETNRLLVGGYVFSRLVEGALMVVGGVFLLFPSLEGYRNAIYSHVHIYFFIAGALLFYVLLYRTPIVPRFIAIWGGVATLGLLAVTLLGLIGISSPILAILIIPMVLNELFLAFWLIFKGFSEQPESGSRSQA